jgi:hypothetical protein
MLGKFPMNQSKLAVEARVGSIAIDGGEMWWRCFDDL